MAATFASSKRSGIRTFVSSNNRGSGLLQQNKNCAFAFDIDGVLLRGSKVIPEGPKALKLLNQYKIPWILLTNSGGKKEKERVEELSEKFGDGVEISEGQFLQSHTPFKNLTNKYNRVLVSGGDADNCRYVAESYGFKDVVMSTDIVRQLGKDIWPYHRFQPDEIDAWSRPNVDLTKPFDAILIFNEPRDMGTDIQIILDLLLSKNGQLGTRKPNSEMTGIPSIPIHFSHNDLIWSTDYPVPRFGEGAFRAMVESLYFECTNHKLQNSIIGKPSRYTYDYADNLLKEWSSGDSDDLTVYMVGDNPASDIIGANNYGWKSMLVRTGVYRDEDKPNLITTPDHITDNVLDAVNLVIEKHNK